MSRPYTVVIHGLPHFCQKLRDVLQDDGWDIRYRSRSNPLDLAKLFADLTRADLAYTWGGRVSQGKFLRLARLAGVKNLVMLWSGSDIFFANEQHAEGKLDPWIAKQTHWAVSPWIASEARAIGLDCEFVQASFVQPEPNLAPLPAEFSVLCYVPNAEKAPLYGWDSIVEVARRLPAVKFHIVGLQDAGALSATPNVRFTGWVRDLAPHLRAASVLWRPVRHDGLSFMVLEALAQGRDVIYSYPFEGCIFADNAESGAARITELERKHSSGQLVLNQAGVDSIRASYAPNIVRDNLLRRWEHIIEKSRQKRSSATRAETPEEHSIH
jgi:hypothetical protein